ncbi:unnamed protein product, partial [marine sediment metagenome]
MKCPKCKRNMTFKFDPFGLVQPRWVCFKCGKTLVL